jgi:hypothetical protein
VEHTRYAYKPSISITWQQLLLACWYERADMNLLPRNDLHLAVFVLTIFSSNLRALLILILNEE